MDKEFLDVKCPNCGFLCHILEDWIGDYQCPQCYYPIKEKERG